MSVRDARCNDIVGNIRDLADEWRNLGHRLADIQQRGEQLNAQIGQLESQRTSIVTSGLPGRALIGGPAGVAITAAEAIAKANRLARLDSALSETISKRDRLRQQWQNLERARDQKLRLIRRSQENYSRLDCFDLGYSHEVLNLP